MPSNRKTGLSKHHKVNHTAKLSQIFHIILTHQFLTTQPTVLSNPVSLNNIEINTPKILLMLSCIRQLLSESFDQIAEIW